MVHMLGCRELDNNWPSAFAANAAALLTIFLVLSITTPELYIFYTLKITPFV